MDPLYGIALISSDSVNGQKLIFRYPVNFGGPTVKSLYFTEDTLKGWKRFTQLFNPFSKTEDIVISIGDTLSMIPRCIINGNDQETAETSAFVIVVLLNSQVVESCFSLEAFEDFTTKLSMCLLREESRCSYLLKEKALLLPIFNEYKQSLRLGKRKERVSEQYYLDLQLERSQLARELSQMYHEINRYHHTSILLHNNLPFHYTFPTQRKKNSCVEYYTSELPVSEKNIEKYYSLLLLHDPSYYLQAEKCDKNAFLTRFVHLASPFLTFEEMSVLLNVPIEKIFYQALSLQAANTATIMICITKHTHISLIPDVDFESKKELFANQFKSLGSLYGILHRFESCPRLEDAFRQNNLDYSQSDNDIIFKALVWLLQQRLLLPVAVHCQYLSTYVPFQPREIRRNQPRKNSMEMHPRASDDVHVESSASQLSFNPKNGFYDVVHTSELKKIRSDIVISSKLKFSFPESFNSDTLSSRDLDTLNSLDVCDGSEIPNCLQDGSVPLIAPYPPGSLSSQDGLFQSPDINLNHGNSNLRPPDTFHSTQCIPSMSPGAAALLEKCKPLMKDHYCVDEICYILSISHEEFYKMVRENEKQFFFYYCARNLSLVLSGYTM